MQENRNTFWLFLASVFLGLAVAIYWPARSGVWMMDDDPNIVFNYRLSDFSDSLSLFLGGRGISFFSFALDIRLWGLDSSAFRWVNVLIHTINSLLVVLLLRRLFDGTWRWAIVGGLFFLCHPVQTSAVSYIVQRMTLLSAFFALIAILLADRYFILLGEGRGADARKYLLISVFFGIFSVMSKENTVLLPLVIPLLAWFRGRFRGKGRLSEGWKPAFILWLSISAVALLLQYLSSDSTVGRLSGVQLYKDTGKALYEILGDQDRAFLPVRYFLSQLEVFWVYLGLVIFPLHQALDYCWPIPDLRLSLPQFGTLTLVVGILWLSYKRRDRQPFLFFGLVWIFIFVIVESSIIPLDPLFEHRLYLPMVGVILILSNLGVTRAKEIAFPAAVVAICVLAFLSWERNRLWGDSLSFWQSNVRVVERAPRPVGKLARALFAQKRFEEAETETKRLASVYNIGDIVIGESLFFSGKTDAAMAAFQKAALNEPGANGVELFNGYKAIQEKRYAEATDWLNRADLRSVNDVRSLYFRGILAEAQNNVLQAVEYYVSTINAAEASNHFDLLSFNNCYALWAQERRALLVNQLADWLRIEESKVLSASNNIQIRRNFANQLIRLGLYSEGAEHYEALRAMETKDWSLYYVLAFSYEMAKRFYDSDKNYEIARELSLNNPEVSFSYANSLVKRGKYSAAYEVLAPLTQLYPNDGRFLIVTGDLQRGKGKINSARDLYQRASLIPGYQATALYRLNNLNRQAGGKDE